MFLQNVCVILLTIAYYTDDVIATDYCSLCEEGTHTLCKYQAVPGRACLEYRTLELTDLLRRDIVNMHNEIRSFIASGKEKRGNPGPQPTATNMKKLKWDYELHVIAQRWADQCMSEYKMAHDICRRSERFDVGQNVVGILSRGQNFPGIRALIDEWYKQIDAVSEENVKSFSSRNADFRDIASYGQLLWADTEYIGCGYSCFKEDDGYEGYYVHQLVCNYGPKGNLLNQPIYHIGKPCSQCSECDTQFPGLCKDLNTSPDENKEVISHFYSDFPKFIGQTAVPDEGTGRRKNTVGSIQETSSVTEEIYEEDIKTTKTEPRPKSLGRARPLGNNTKIRNRVNQVTTTEEIETKQPTSGIMKVTMISEELTQVKEPKTRYVINSSTPALKKHTIGPTSVTSKYTLPKGVFKVKGIWRDSECKCNYVYRSCSMEILSSLFPLVILQLVNFM